MALLGDTRAGRAFLRLNGYSLNSVVAPELGRRSGTRSKRGVISRFRLAPVKDS
jgi:hypothetical protein